MEYLLDVKRAATGGAGIANLPDGRVAIVDGAIPGDRVRALVTKDHKRHVEATVTEVVEPAPGRIEPPCPHVRSGCGGCDWQHVAAERASELRIAVVDDCLRRLGRLPGIEIRPGPFLAPGAYRTVLRAAVIDGRLGFHRARSDEVIETPGCLVAHPLADELLRVGHFPGATEASIKVGARTGERLVVVDTDRDCRVPPDVEVVGPGEVGHMNEIVDGRRFRVSGTSFFQCRPDGAEAMIQLVRQALGEDLADENATLLDAYAGVGLFGLTVGKGHRVTMIESNPSSVADAVANAELDPEADVTVVASDVERWRPEPVDLVVADPARSGLGKRGVAVLDATEARRLALVSCDPASLGRDARLLVDAGFELEWVSTVDLFGRTSHVEAVSSFVRARGRGSR